jgi:hypothetical protein
VVKSRIALVVLGAFFVASVWTAPAYALLITTTSPIRADFTLPIADPFSLPALVLDHTVSFGTDRLNPSEAYEVATYDANGVLLGTDSYLNSGVGSIIGCACTGGILDVPLTTADGYLIISSLGGSFDVNGVVVLAYDAADGRGDQARAEGVISAMTNGVPEPQTYALLLAGLGLIGFMASRSKKS